jgi:serralysin
MCGICSTLGVNIHAIDTQQAVYTSPRSYSLDSQAGGTYREKKILDHAGVIAQIDSGRTLNVGSDGVITYGFFDHKHALGLNNNPSFGEGKGYTTFTESQKTAARLAINYWDDLIAPGFVEATPKPGASDWAKNTVDIWLANTTTGPAQAWAYYPNYGNQYTRVSSDTWIHTPTSNVTNQWFSFGGYGNTTLIHELGHSVGLSHPGAYNGAGATTYAAQAEYAQDSMQYSIMSYWSGAETGSVTRNWLTSQANYAQTPMVHDILTVQAKYGADLTTRVGDTTYGFNSNAGRDVFDFSKNKFPYLTIYDAGGNDTLDASGFTAGNFINLAPGSFSSVSAAVPTLAEINAGRAALGAELGITLNPTTQAAVDAAIAARLPLIESKIMADTGVAGVTATQYDNLAIAYGTVIENAIGGSARDVLWGNHVANRLEGRGGDDVLNGFAGADTLVGGAGNDTFQFSTLNDLGNTITDFTAGDKIDVSRFDTDAAMTGDQAFTFIGNAAFSNTAGQLRYANGVVQGDVNGDGIADFSVIMANNAALSASDFIL